MNQRIQTAAILMILHGCHLILFGLIFSFNGGILLLLRMQGRTPGGDQEVFWVGIAFLASALLDLVFGALHLAGGVCALYGRHRRLILTALYCNIPAFVTFHLTPLSVAMAIYGLRVFHNRDVIRAFEPEPVEVPGAATAALPEEHVSACRPTAAAAQYSPSPSTNLRSTERNPQ